MYSIDSNKEYCITLHLVGYTKEYINDARSHERQILILFNVHVFEKGEQNEPYSTENNVNS
jgi:hypothetical protein